MSDDKDLDNVEEKSLKEEDHNDDSIDYHDLICSGGDMCEQFLDKENLELEQLTEEHFIKLKKDFNGLLDESESFGLSKIDWSGTTHGHDVPVHTTTANGDSVTITTQDTGDALVEIGCGGLRPGLKFGSTCEIQDRSMSWGRPYKYVTAHVGGSSEHCSYGSRRRFSFPETEEDQAIEVTYVYPAENEEDEEYDQDDDFNDDDGLDDDDDDDDFDVDYDEDDYDDDDDGEYEDDEEQEEGLSSAEINQLPESNYLPPQETSANPDTREEDCPICLATFELTDTIRTLPCRHYFHSTCIDEWFKKKTCCPTCKQNIRAKILAASLDQILVIS